MYPVRGFTLLEMMVSVAIGTAITMSALVLTADMQRYSHRHMGELGSSQRLRDALELLSHDIRHAGVGVGYSEAAVFDGMVLGSIQTTGGASFQTDNRSISTVDGQLMTDDFILRLAEGERRTILYLESGSGLICDGLEFGDNELVVVTARNGRGARTLRIQGSSSSACTRGFCMDGCQQISYTEDEAYRSDASAVGRTFAAGDIFRSYETVVWFVAPDDDGYPSLRRATDSALASCTQPNTRCGSEVADGIEVVQYTIWRLDDDSNQWVQLPKSQVIDTYDRLRVDLEMIARARSNPKFGAVQVQRSQLEPSLCVPEGCEANATDQSPRVTLRTTIEVKNAGYLQIQ
ncbi:MAG: prepilin-type N-terminal cleavage/methylation domain-containing protein [Myxococcales bacterium]|nr:prepilin-type N-terminal cleavage/methylation domain-containing protein [Myxococcales bacterium]